MAVAEHRAAADRLDQGNFAKQEVLKVVPLHLSIFLQPAAELWRSAASFSAFNNVLTHLIRSLQNYLHTGATNAANTP